MRIQLKEKRQETTDVMSFIFDLRDQPLSYLAGQYVFFELDSLAYPDERGKRRHFTISSSSTEPGIVMFTTRLRGSGFKETLRHAEPGYELTMETPRGSLVLPAGDVYAHVFIAGGIGITTFRSILRYAADTHLSLRATLLYFNRAPADIVFRQELDEIAGRLPTVQMVHSVDQPGADWAGETGRLSETLLRKYVPDLQPVLYWLSGPPPMVNAYAELLLGLGVAGESIRKDSFTGY
jgi:ferredoxin-NADP reductase